MKPCRILSRCDWRVNYHRLLLLMVQAKAILANPLAIILIAIPLTLQTYLIFWITAFWIRSVGQPLSIAAPRGHYRRVQLF